MPVHQPRRETHGQTRVQPAEAARLISASPPLSCLFIRHDSAQDETPTRSSFLFLFLIPAHFRSSPRHISSLGCSIIARATKRGTEEDEKRVSVTDFCF